ncbi:MAG: hypothetical protein ACM3QX_04585 [Syntrophomonadaceae bacterium]
MRIATAAVLTAFLFAGCGGSSNFTLNQNYENKDFSDKVLLIAPIANDAVKVVIKEDVIRDFPKDKREPEAIIKDMVYNSITKYAGEHLTGVKIYKAALDSSLFLSQYDKSRYFRLSEPLDNHELLPFNYVPRKEVLNSSNIKPNLILVINRLQFGRAIHTFSTGANPVQSFITSGLTGEYEFILFDYDKNEIVAVGGSTADFSSTYTMARTKWDGIIMEIVPEIFSNMTFFMSNQ